MRRSIIFLSVLIVSFLLCGAASAATVKTGQINVFDHKNVGIISKPDLKPSTIKVTSQGSYIIKLGVKNQGKSTSHSFTSNVYIDGKLLGSVYYPMAPVGSTVYGKMIVSPSKVYMLHIASGNHRIKNVVDPKNTISESNEYNNIETELVPLAPLVPYLAITEFVVTPKSAKAVRVKDYSGKIRYDLINKKVTVTMILKNVSTQPLKKINFVIGSAYNKMNGMFWSSLVTKNFDVPIKPGEKEYFQVSATITMVSYNLGSIPARVEASAWDKNNVMGTLKEGVLGHIFQNVFSVT